MYLILYLLLGQSFFDNGVVVHNQEAVLGKPVAISPIAATHLVKLTDSFGTGVAFTHNNKTYVATCAHVVANVKPKEQITYNGHQCWIIAKDIANDVCILECDTDIGAGVDIGGVVKAGQTLLSYGSNSDYQENITKQEHNIGEVKDNVVLATGSLVFGRSGSGLYAQDNKLVGVLCGYNSQTKLQVFTPVSKLISLLPAKSYKVTFYSGKHCTYCKQQHAITDNVNDRRIIADWTEDTCPSWILKRLPVGYTLPIAVVDTIGGSKSWPQTSGVYSIDQLVGFCVAAKAVPVAKIEPMGGMKLKSMGAINCKPYIDDLFEWHTKYVPMGCKGTFEWDRSGNQSFNLYGGTKTKLTVATVFGNAGQLRLAINYPPNFQGEMLNIRELGLHYTVVDGNVKLDLDSITIYGLEEELNSRLNNAEQPKQFALMTLWTIISVIRDIWLVMHPTADLTVGGSLSASTQLIDQDTIQIDCGAAIRLKITILMKFDLAVKQITITKQHITVHFDGSRLIKQYTFDIK